MTKCLDSLFNYFWDCFWSVTFSSTAEFSFGVVSLSHLLAWSKPSSGPSKTIWPSQASKIEDLTRQTVLNITLVRPSVDNSISVLAF